MSIDHQMTRYFEYMRPRYSNPTYASSNVGATMGLFHSPPYSPPILKVSDSRPAPQFSQQLSQPEPKPEPAAYDNNGFQRQQSEKASQGSSRHRKTKSLMSNYGTSSLGRLPKMLNERDIYEKQEKKYNIITIQPKEYQQTIKKYPKYRLENQDMNYYRKLQIQDEYNRTRESRLRMTNNPELPRQPSPREVERTQSFRPKMLNNIDELGGVL